MKPLAMEKPTETSNVTRAAKGKPSSVDFASATDSYSSVYWMPFQWIEIGKSRNDVKGSKYITYPGAGGWWCSFILDFCFIFGKLKSFLINTRALLLRNVLVSVVLRRSPGQAHRLNPCTVVLHDTIKLIFLATIAWWIILFLTSRYSPTSAALPLSHSRRISKARLAISKIQQKQ